MLGTREHAPVVSGSAESHAHPECAWPTNRREWDTLASCTTCGLTLLRLYVNSAAWVVRRVENIEFLDERTVRRRVSVDFLAPPDTVVLTRADGIRQRVLPLTIMRRKSLVNFDLRDERGDALPLLGLRENQALTLAVARAWADRALLDVNRTRVDGDDVDVFLRRIVQGDQSALRAAHLDVRRRKDDRADTSSLALLARDRYFASVMDRLTAGFLLFALDSGPEGSRRIFKFSYDEPLTVRYSESGYRGHTEARPEWRLSYGLGAKRLPRWNRAPLLAALGLRPTIVRFPVPAAELAASFHFSVSAPPQVSIVEASLLAGHPNLHRSPDPAKDKRLWERDADAKSATLRRRPSFDSVDGGYPNVDLHVVDVPYGSLSRAQVHLQASTTGWLATAVVATWLATATLLVSSFRSQVRNDTASVLLVTFSAAMVAALARDDPHRMVARLVSLVRGLAAISTGLTLAGAMVFAFFPRDTRPWMAILTACSLIPTALVTGAWWSSLRTSTREDLNPTDRQSPWEQHLPGGGEELTGPEFHETFSEDLEVADYPYDVAVRELGFDVPAIKVASSEGVRRSFPWTREFTETFQSRLRDDG